MIGSLYTHLIAASAAAAMAASGAAYVQAQRYGLQIERLQHQATSAQLAGATQAVQDMAGFQKGLNDALGTFQRQVGVNATAQQALAGSLRDLRGTTAGLRGDFADLPGRITAAAQPALREYATACTAVFESMAAAGGRLAERGADIAAKADGHAADVGLMQGAWAKRSIIR